MNNNLKYINTMKKIVGIAFVFVMLFISGGFLKAQGKYGKDSAQCIRYLSYYKEYFKQKNYDDALPNWRKAYNICLQYCHWH